VAIAKVCGIETEYGIHHLGGSAAPTTTSSLIINAYVAAAAGPAQWDFVDESPGRDARGFSREASQPPDLETHLVNVVLTNGARYYVDHAHPEYSTPECTTPMELVVADRAGEVVLRRSMAAAKQLLEPGEEIVIYKNNSDGKGNSYGCHENYLLDRALPFGRIVAQLTPHLVTRQIYTGAGKVGHETVHHSPEAGHFQISSRAEFFEEIVGLETTLKRPIINTRDEPHADPAKYRRLHVIVGDANLAQVATYLKVGVTAILLAMIEDDVLSVAGLDLAQPVRAIHEVSEDPDLRATVELCDGRKLTALQLQWEYHSLARKYAEARGLEPLGDEPSGAEVLDRWESVLEALETAPRSLSRQLDWVAKLELLEAFADRHRLAEDDPRLYGLALQYHDLRPERSLFDRLGMEQLVGEAAVNEAVTEPPKTTRAYFRGQCLRHFGDAVATANWDSVVFDLGEGPLRRVPMMEPTRGSAQYVDSLFADCGSPAELLRRLDS
jgi:proteasome accessory factor PafA2